jgi:hypothetical protein
VVKPAEATSTLAADRSDEVAKKQPDLFTKRVVNHTGPDS